MKIFLDNCMDLRVERLFAGHEVSHARALGWRDLVNGRLIAAAAGAGFAVMVTVDKSIRHEQNLGALPLAILELGVPRNRFRDIALLAPHFSGALEQTKRFALVSIKPDGTIECIGAGFGVMGCAVVCQRRKAGGPSSCTHPEERHAPMPPSVQLA